MRDDHRQAFKEEAYELLSELEESLLELERTPHDAELVGRVFRAMHTIKGSGAMFGFDEIAAFTHEVETVFDKVRDRRIRVTGALINLTLTARDTIKCMLDETSPDEARAGQTSEIIDAFRRLSSEEGALPHPPQESASAPAWTSPPPSSGAVTYRHPVPTRGDDLCQRYKSIVAP